MPPPIAVVDVAFIAFIVVDVAERCVVGVLAETDVLLLLPHAARPTTTMAIPTYRVMPMSSKLQGLADHRSDRGINARTNLQVRGDVDVLARSRIVGQPSKSLAVSEHDGVVARGE
jgi:hypothetical protein